MKLDVVISGVGGQGVVTLTKVLVQAALKEGFDAHFLAQSGLAQLGTPVVAHARIGTPAGPSPKVPHGGADVVVGLERLEALRLAPYPRPDAVVLLSDAADPPYTARCGDAPYPGTVEVDAAFPGSRVIWIPATEMAKQHGPPGLISAVMLGALAGASGVVERDHLVVALRGARPELENAEVEAFFEGYRFLTGRDH